MSIDGQETDLVSGRYRVLRSYAKGGLGEVFLAHDAMLDRQVALKEIRRDISPNVVRNERFLLEARVTGRLEHPGIVPVYDLGTHDDGRAYYAMRLIKGETLRAAVERFHAEPESDYTGLSFHLLLSWFVSVCKTMAYAHSQGVLHRDLKPTNIMLGDFGETLVVDWGLAKPISGSSTAEIAGGSDGQGAARGCGDHHRGPGCGIAQLHEPGAGRRQPGKTRPRQRHLQSRRTLYVILTDRMPFEGDGNLVLERVRRGIFPPPQELKPLVPRAVQAICLKAMALRPEEQYPSALDLARELECWLADRPVAAFREPWTLKARRFLRQHQTFVSGLAAALSVGFLALGLAVPVLSYAWRSEFRRREQERRRANSGRRQHENRTGAAGCALASERKADEERDRAEKALAFLVQAFRLPDPSLDGRSLRVAELLEPPLVRWK